LQSPLTIKNCLIS